MEATTWKLGFHSGFYRCRSQSKYEKKKLTNIVLLGRLCGTTYPKTSFFKMGPYSRKDKHSGKAVRVNLASTEEFARAAEVKPGSCARPV